MRRGRRRTGSRAGPAWLVVVRNLIFGGLALGLAAVLLMSSELGFRLGMRTATRGVPKALDHAFNWQIGVLGLAALLIGFTFAMAVARFDARKQVLVQEANAIGTAYLRTQLLEDGVGGDVRALMRRYLDSRIALYDAVAQGRRVDQVERDGKQLQAQIWSRIAAVGRADPHAITTGLLLASTNEMIDRADERAAMRETPVPPTVFVVVILAAAIAMASTGYACGLGNKRLPFGMIVMPLLVVGVVMLVFDIAHPSLGVVRVPDVSLLHLKQGL